MAQACLGHRPRTRIARLRGLTQHRRNAEVDGYARGALTVLGLAEALVDAVRETAGCNPLVGPGVMINCLPRPAVEGAGPKGVMLASGPMGDVPTFLSVRPGAATGELVGPIFVSGHDGVIMSEFLARPVTGEEQRS